MKNLKIDWKKKIAFTSPLTLIFCGACAVATLLGTITGGATTRALFSVYRSSLLNVLTWLRLFLHVCGHATWTHLFSNLMLILLLGPVLEKRYGWQRVLLVMGVTAVVTGLAQMLIFPGSALLGASGVVFAFIMLTSFSVGRDGSIPLTFLLVVLLYLGQELVEGLSSRDNISQLTHILGGLTGAGMGWLYSRGGDPNVSAPRPHKPLFQRKEKKKDGPAPVIPPQAIPPMPQAQAVPGAPSAPQSAPVMQPPVMPSAPVTPPSPAVTKEDIMANVPVMPSSSSEPRASAPLSPDEPR